MVVLEVLLLGIGKIGHSKVNVKVVRKKEKIRGAF